MSITVVQPPNDAVGYVSAIRRRGDAVWIVGGHWGKPLVWTTAPPTGASAAGVRRRKTPPTPGLRDVLVLGDEHVLVVGESGGVFETSNGGERWKPIDVGTTRCLFAIERAQGLLWVGGDELLLTSADGSAWRKPPVDLSPHGRIQRVVHIRNDLWVTTYQGQLTVVRGHEVERIAINAGGPALTGVAFTPKGQGLVVGDQGTMFATSDRGRTWTRLEVVASDLEDVLWADGLFVVVGADGVVLTSADGQHFRRIDVGRRDHLWCALLGVGGLLVGGEAGLLLHITRDELEAPGQAPHGGARATSRDEPAPTLDTLALVGGDALACGYGPAGGSAFRRTPDGAWARLPGVSALGSSADGTWLALVTGERIEVRTGMDRAAQTVLDLPRGLGPVRRVTPLAGGARVLVLTERGVWLVSERAVTKLDDSVEAAASPDGRFLVTLARVYAGTTCVAELATPRAPGAVAVAGSVAYVAGALLALDRVPTTRKNPVRLPEYEGDTRLRELGPPAPAACALEHGFVVADGNAVRHCSPEGELGPLVPLAFAPVALGRTPTHVIALARDGESVMLALASLC